MPKISTRSLIKVFAVVALGLLVGACTGDDDESAIVKVPAPGPCVQLYLTPVLEVTAATVGQGGAGIGSLTISAIRIDGREYRLDDILGQATENVEPAGDVLVGRIPFGLGVLEGHYALDVSAPGMRGLTIEVDAAYGENTGGCPSYSSGATDVAVVMEPE